MSTRGGTTATNSKPGLIRRLAALLRDLLFSPHTRALRDRARRSKNDGGA